MAWNWEQKDWPNFSYDARQLAPFESRFLKESGVLLGIAKHLKEEDKETLILEIMSNEALKTSEIEGEYLNRDSVQSSIRRQFGLQSPAYRRSSPAEQGIAEMMVDLYRSFASPLTHAKLFSWHQMITRGRTDLQDIGSYRIHEEPMQIVSGPLSHQKIHFEAPPSSKMAEEMDQFIGWFNKTAPSGSSALPLLTRAGIAHLYFICIHPFEDGNGRVGRAIAEKALAQSLGEPALLALSYTIEKHKSAYYNALEKANKSNEITSWLLYFAQTVLSAQEYTQAYSEFLIHKTQLYDRIRGKLNARQEKVLARIFREGPEGFKGGLSAENYISITQTSRATATRDLSELVAMGALVKSGERKHTRYELGLTVRSSAAPL